MPGIRRTDPRRMAYRLIGPILGGTLTSRLNSNLGEDKGYTYGASSRHAMRGMGGSFIAGATVRADATGASLPEFRALHSGDLNAAELTRGRGALRTQAISAFSRLDRMAG